MNTKAPFSFDGHGINDAEGNRIAKVQSCEPYTDATNEFGGRVRNPEFDALSNLFAEAPEVRQALEALYFSFTHDGNGNTKGNRAKTDIIKYNEDVRAALDLARQVIYFHNK